MSSKKQWITTEGPWPNEPLPKEERIIAPNPRPGRVSVGLHVLRAMPAIAARVFPSVVDAQKRRGSWRRTFSEVPGMFFSTSWDVLHDSARLYRLGFRRQILVNGRRVR